MNYDPGIAESFRCATALKKIDLWPVYDRIRSPTFVVRGGEFDLLTAETVQAMGERGPRPVSVEVQGVGHAPMFMDAAQIRIVRGFFSLIKHPVEGSKKSPIPFLTLRGLQREGL